MSRATLRPPGQSAAEAESPPVPALWPTAVVQMSLALAGAAVAASVVSLNGLSPRGQELVFVIAFGIAFPAGCLAGTRLGAQASRASREHLALLAGCAGGGLLALTLLARLVYELGGSASVTVLSGLVAWAAGLVVLVARRPRRPPARAARVACTAAAAALPVTVLAFLPDRLLRPGPLAISIAAALAVTLLLVRRGGPRLGSWPGALVDGALLALVALWVVDVAVYLPHLPYDPFTVFRDPSGTLTPNDENYVMLIHQDFWLGPVNDILHGRAVLVDTYGQYGVGVLYFLAGFFHIAPFGYGPFALLVGALTALQFSAAYAILRLAGSGRDLAALALFAAVVAVAFGTIFSLADLPSVGGLRYGLAYAVLLAAVAQARWPDRARGLRALSLGIVALASVWSLETFAFVAVTYAATTAAVAATGPGSLRARGRVWASELLPAGGVALAAVALLGLLTIALTGHRPHLRAYLAFFQSYGGSNVGTTLGIPVAVPWSAGLAVGALYMASAVGVIGAARWRARPPDLMPWLIAIAGVTALGAITFTYWVSRPDPRALPPLALPAILAGALWVELARRMPDVMSRRGRQASIALAAWIAALAVVFAWPDVERKYTRAAVWQALPGGPSLTDNVRGLWRSPPVDPRAVDGERLIDRHFPPGPVVALLEPDLMVETLMRSDRVDRLPLADLIQDDLIRDFTLKRVERAVADIPPGTPMLIQLTPDPRVDVIQSPNRLHAGVLALLRRRFDFALVQTTPSGLSVVRLVPHGTAGAAAR